MRLFGCDKKISFSNEVTVLDKSPCELCTYRYSVTSNYYFV
jgi:hypothetical protein